MKWSVKKSEHKKIYENMQKQVRSMNHYVVQKTIEEKTMTESPLFKKL